MYDSIEILLNLTNKKLDTGQKTKQEMFYESIKALIKP